MAAVESRGLASRPLRVPPSHQRPIAISACGGRRTPVRTVNVSLLAVAIIVLCAMPGCSGGAGAGDDDRVRSAMRMVGIEYSRFLVAHRDVAPADEAALRTFIDGQISRTPDYGVASAEELLATTRDGQPLTVITGKKIASPDQPGVAWAAYEQTGVDGKRLIVNTRGDVVEMETSQVDAIVAP